MDTENKYRTYDIQCYYIPILEMIDTICRNNNINYTISDGTLIGAVRHGGFIPWDDDIDISFDRKNFNKFIDAFKREALPDYTIVHDMWVYRVSRKDNPGLLKTFPEGCIDLLIFDNAPDNIFFNTIKNLVIKLLHGMLKNEVKYEGFSPLHKLLLFITHFLGLLFDRRTLQNCYDKVAQWGNKKTTQYLGRYYCSYRYISNIRYEKSMLDEYIDMTFETQKCMSVKNWDYFLKTDFGNYMELPPEEKRTPIHKRKDG